MEENGQNIHLLTAKIIWPRSYWHSQLEQKIMERSFSQMKMMKSKIRNQSSNENLAHLIRIAIEGPDIGGKH